MKGISVGIDDMALYVPSLYLHIQTIAEARGIPYEKLNRGLGLTKLAIPDVHEDTATMAANAVVEIIEKNKLNPKAIGRIYLGTESALDGAKPTATYVLEMLRRKYREAYGKDCFLNCDVVDLTFACVGGVDALQNTVDWVKGNKERIGIVVCSDFAKYELASTGEYTQGAGAIAMLVKHNPRLLAFNDIYGVATMGVHDFFKPKMEVDKLQIIQEVLDLAGITHISARETLAKLSDSLEVNGVLDSNDSKLSLRKDTPVFDGQYSNFTYQNRIREAFLNFKDKKIAAGLLTEDAPILGNWERLIFHLPYAAHGRRIASELFMLELQSVGNWGAFAKENELVAPVESDFESKVAHQKAYGQFLRAITKTKGYKEFVINKLSKAEGASSEVGNMYACSIFLALMGTLEADFLDNEPIDGKDFGFVGYGSGSKSKVFEAKIQPEWKKVVQQFHIKSKLANRQALDYATYEKLHRMQLDKSLTNPKGTFVLARISSEKMKEGARYYQWIPAATDEATVLSPVGKAKV
ncbi:MAG: hydroxymethylglutaryl-CoA synthase [Bacteroidota bacterium]